jgi:hypothetical protein
LQEGRYQRRRARIDRKQLAVLEFRAGIAVPTVRRECQRQAGPRGGINPRDTDASSGSIALAAGALQAIGEIDTIMERGSP